MKLIKTIVRANRVDDVRDAVSSALAMMEPQLKTRRVAITRTPRLAATAPEALFERPELVWERPRNYDVMPDGSGFVMIRRGEGAAAVRTLRVAFDWFAELEARVPGEGR